jgi:hypothetical protein
MSISPFDTTVNFCVCLNCRYEDGEIDDEDYVDEACETFDRDMADGGLWLGCENQVRRRRRLLVAMRWCRAAHPPRVTAPQQRCERPARRIGPARRTGPEVGE